MDILSTPFGASQKERPWPVATTSTPSLTADVALDEGGNGGVARAEAEAEAGAGTMARAAKRGVARTVDVDVLILERGGRDGVRQPLREGVMNSRLP